ncbi:unnamed protein product [Rotaria magnacalcarata]|uniref:Uncharacterized protein n=1 Tax=Rotaria magnacalcarata TaxID=392030 RepID=A0A8S2N7Y5_9BILA|nr:unnamed protein product [Rotaria magnacalcarata]
MTDDRETIEGLPDTDGFTKRYLVDDRIQIRFFENRRFSSTLKKHLSKVYKVACQIVENNENRDEETSLYLNFSGDVKKNVKDAREFSKAMFSSMQMKTYNDAKMDGKVINWSSKIYSERVLQKIQKIFDNRKMFTVWEKTDLFTGYYVVYYFNTGTQQFDTSIEYIDRVLLEEISFAEINNENSNVKSKLFLQEFYRFIRDSQKQHEEIAVLYCKEQQLKVSLFGRKQQLKILKKQMQQLIHKHKLRTCYITMDESQRNYLLDECSEKLREIERQYTDDDVKFNVRQNEFQAPEYLVEKVKASINQMIFDNFTVTFELITPEASQVLTTKEETELKYFALINNCRTMVIETKCKRKAFSVPKALTRTPISRLSKYITEQSTLFSSSDFIYYKAAVSHASIEIHSTSSHFMEENMDLTVLSSAVDAKKEGIDANKGNTFFETPSGRRILFLHWTPATCNGNAQIKSRLKEYVKTFISTSLQCISSNVEDHDKLERIIFSTTEWENCSNKNEFASEMINEIQYQLQTRIGCRWRILFVFSKNEKQTELYKEFLSVMLTRKNEKDCAATISIPVTVTEIKLSMSRNNLWKKCQNLFNNYIKQTICITKRLENEVDLKLWTQDMINAFYQYCITKCIILHMLLNQTEQVIELTGRVDAVHEALDKFHIMTKIFKQKVIDVTDSKMQSELPNTPKPASKQINGNQPIKSQEYFNIWFSYCKFDESICSRLKKRLIGEGYLVSSNSTGDQKGTIQNCDLIVIYLSEEYAIKNANEIKDAKSSSKTILLIKPTKLACRGFIIELDENNFDREYDKLLIEILLYTKPGRVGQPIAKLRAVPSEKFDNEIDVELPYFTNDRFVARISQFTNNDKEERKLSYKKNLKILMKSHRIPADEMKELMKSCESIIENVDNDEHQYYSYKDRHTDWLIEAKNRDSDYTENERLLMEGYRNELISCVKRWQQKKTNKIRVNITPFTLTGDINDALFLIPIIGKEPWCNFDELDTAENNMMHLNAYGDDDWFNLKYYEPWFTLEESHDYYHELIDKDTPRRLRRSQEQPTAVDVPTDEQKGMIMKVPQKRQKKSTFKPAGINENKNVSFI